VLLKNDGSLLPLPKKKSLKIALIGADASAPYTAGGGSGHVANSNMAVSPMQAFESLGYEVTSATGCTTGQCSMEKDYDYSSGDHNIKSVKVADENECCQLCARESKCKFWTLVPGKSCFLKTSNAGRKANKGFTSGSAPVREPDLDGAASVAAAADVAFVFGSAEANEGRDRSSLNLGDVSGCAYPQDQLIETVAAKQAKTVVVMAVPGPILTDWRDKVAAIFVAFLPGEQYGNALTDLIFGDVMPQAKLPFTMPLAENDQKMTTHQWPGIPSKDFPGHNEVVYSEGQINGYRWYDKNDVAPAFPFGFGLTYGDFKYSDLKVAGRTISFTAAGTGCDTPQIYISYPGAESDSSVPNKVLRYYQKTCESTTSISYTLTDRDVSTWDVDKKQWVVVKGTYELLVAQASQGGVSLTGSFTI